MIVSTVLFRCPWQGQQGSVISVFQPFSKAREAFVKVSQELFIFCKAWSLSEPSGELLYATQAKLEEIILF